MNVNGDNILELDFDTPFFPAYGIVTIPINEYVFYRGYDMRYPIVSNRPAYYGSLKTAIGYLRNNENRTVTAFTNTQSLKLLDVRFMKDILREMFRINPTVSAPQLSTTLSFGLCSLNHQYELAKEYFTDESLSKNLDNLYNSLKENHNRHVEKPGVRIAETSNDAETMSFLKTLFEGFIDGFISPKQATPFHIEKNKMLNAEMIIFNPKMSGMIDLKSLPKETYKIKVDALYNDYGRKIHIGTPQYPYDLLLTGDPDYKNNDDNINGGGLDDIESILHFPSVEQINMRFDNDPIIQENWRKGHEDGLYWRGMSNIINFSSNSLYQNESAPKSNYSITGWNIENSRANKNIDITEEDREKIKKNIRSEIENNEYDYGYGNNVYYNGDTSKFKNPKPLYPGPKIPIGRIKNKDINYPKSNMNKYLNAENQNEKKLHRQKKNKTYRKKKNKEEETV
jgi:hypothetical protein